MFRHGQRFLIPIYSILLLVLTVLSPVFSYAPRLSTSLAGAPINGRIPTGDAVVSPPRGNEASGRLEVRVKNILLPDGALVSVNIGGAEPGDGIDVGMLKIVRGEGMLSMTLPFDIEKTDPIAVRNGVVIILSGGVPWK